MQGLTKPVGTVLFNVSGSKQIPRLSPEAVRVGGVSVAQVCEHWVGVFLGPTDWTDEGEVGF